MSGKWLGCPYTLTEYAWGLRKHKLWLPLSAEHNELCAKNIEMLLQLIPVSQNTQTPHTASESPLLESCKGWQQTWHCVLWPVVPRGGPLHCQVSRWDNLPHINWIIYLCRWVQITHNQTPGAWRVTIYNDSVEECGLLQQIVSGSACCSASRSFIAIIHF